MDSFKISILPLAGPRLGPARTADKNVVGLQVGVSSTEKVFPARLTWSSSVRDDVLVQKHDDWVVTGVIPD